MLASYGPSTLAGLRIRCKATIIFRHISGILFWNSTWLCTTIRSRHHVLRQPHNGNDPGTENLLAVANAPADPANHQFNARQNCDFTKFHGNSHSPRKRHTKPQAPPCPAIPVSLEIEPNALKMLKPRGLGLRNDTLQPKGGYNLTVH